MYFWEANKGDYNNILDYEKIVLTNFKSIESKMANCKQNFTPDLTSG